MDRLAISFDSNSIHNPFDFLTRSIQLSFGSEFECRFGGGQIGNSFPTAWIEQATSFEYDPEYINPNSTRVISCDPAFDSSNFGVLVSEYRNGRIAVLLAEEHDKETSEDMADYVAFLYHKFSPVRKIYFDGSQIAWGQSLIKRLPEVRQNPNFNQDIEMYKQNHCNPKINMTVWPVTATETMNKQMLLFVREYLQKGYIMIHPKFNKLIMALYTTTDEEGHLKKQ